jgi:hypothetical protein
MKDLNCRLPNVSFPDLPMCTYASFSDCIQDIANGNDVLSSLSKNDRIFYIAIVVLIVFLIVLFLVRERDCAFFMNDPLWCPF